MPVQENLAAIQSSYLPLSIINTDPQYAVRDMYTAILFYVGYIVLFWIPRVYLHALFMIA